MRLSTDEYYRALKARDARFDGEFFVCVTTTGIYCRPVCPARSPLKKHCRFVTSAATAEEMGFRPCLRCRPETAPGSAEWLGSESTLHRALRLMNDREGERPSIEQVAANIGLSARQLRRIFANEMGTSPKQVVQTERLAIARQLIIDSRMKITEVALAAGFQSIRAFNAAVRESFGMTPTQLRKQHGHATWHTAGHTPGHTPGYATQKSAGTPGAFWPNEPIRLKLGYRPPFAWQELLKYFSYRRIKGLEEVGDSYIRTIQIGQSGGILRVYPEPEKHRFIAEFSLSEPADLSPYTRRIRDLLDLDAAPHEISAHLGQFAPLQIHIKRTPGLRIPGAWTIFEIIVRAIVGQQVSVRAATTVLGRLVEIYGSRLAIEHPGLPNRLFPVSEQLAQQSLTHVGINSAKADTISRIADLFVSDPEFIHSGMRFADARQKLLSVKGIGPWTANYILLRGLRDPDAFPDADLGALRAVGTNDKNELGRLAADWRPWRGYALMYLWSSLDQST